MTPVRRPSSRAKRFRRRNGRCSPRPRRRCSSSACGLPPVAMRSQHWCAKTRMRPRCGATATASWSARCRNRKASRTAPGSRRCASRSRSWRTSRRRCRDGSETEFPDYVSLSNPKPLGLEDAQKLLGADEALVLFLLGDKESYVFALTHDAFDWHVDSSRPQGNGRQGRRLPPRARRRRARQIDRRRQAGRLQCRHCLSALFRAAAAGRGNRQGQEISRHRPLRRADCAAVPSARHRAAEPGRRRRRGPLSRCGLAPPPAGGGPAALGRQA